MRRVVFRRTRLVLALGAWLGVAACGAPPPAALDRLHPCTGDEGPTDAYCGTLRVFENREARAGRTIDLRIVVLPALGTNVQSDPLFFLAGGPGQGAAQMASQIRELFGRVQADRDIVLVDQRGTGKSHPLDCKSDDDSLRVWNESDAQALDRLKRCLETLDADPRLYTTPIAMDDLDEVRAHLGYERINLYGGSYGTRAALVYMRQHADHVRAVVLDGVAPPDMRLPLFFARDAQRALDRLLADCEADERCRQAYPSLTARVRDLFARLEAAPARVRLIHPRTGASEALTVDAGLFANILTGALYSPLVSSLLPELIARAETGDFQGLAALGALNEPATENMSLGMQLSVVCAEDTPRIDTDEIERASAGTLFARHLMTARMKACEIWPKGRVPASYYDPVTSSIPTLVLSGNLDPVTPPSWGDDVTAQLTNARHVVAPAAGHGVILTGCGARLVKAFFDRGRADDLDARCLETPSRPPFFLTPAGPDPAAAPAGGTR